MGYPTPRRARPEAPPPRAAVTGLRAQAPSEELSALLYEQARLLKSIAAKRKQRDTLLEHIDDVAAVVAKAEPLREQALALDLEIHRLFRALLARPRQPRANRRGILLVYEMLQREGVLSYGGLDDDGDDDVEADGSGVEGDPFDAEGGGRRPGSAHTAGSRSGPGAGAGGYSATRPSDAPADQTLRGLFRRLAMAIHPDRVPDEAEKARRTEAMKEVSRAYEERDLARLLNLEKTWMTTGAVEPGAVEDETKRRAAELERTNADLRRQLRALADTVRELRRSPAGQLQAQVRRAQRRQGADPIADIVAETRLAVEELSGLRDYVVSFRDGRLTLDQFLRGPQGGGGGPGGNGDRSPAGRRAPGERPGSPAVDAASFLDEEGLLDIIDVLMNDPPRDAGGGRGKGRGRGRSGRPR